MIQTKENRGENVKRKKGRADKLIREIQKDKNMLNNRKKEKKEERQKQ